MYICQGHFLADHIVIMKDDRPVGRIMSVDTDLLVAERLVGFDPEDGQPLVDLIKIDQVLFKSTIPNGLKDLLPLDVSFVEIKTE